ncbi:uncharacterized protein LOC119102412 [Pollicipes pollicipes]|uniref:uncharacterized protein LOC119102412 n=1 Tax=Pollicipes pollicipes TaxID=41117 RepID=UPI001885890F|nr:uncharacterized protein LOC119102412 [Pollicipes pollicipes]
MTQVVRCFVRFYRLFIAVWFLPGEMSEDTKQADGCCMELLTDTDVTSMEITAEQTGLLSSPDAIAITSMGRLLGQRIHAEVAEYTAVLGRLVLDMQRTSGADAAAARVISVVKECFT